MKACREGRTQELRKFIDGTSKDRKDKRGVVIPDGSPLIAVFDKANVFDKQVKAITSVVNIVREQLGSENVSDELRAVDLEKLNVVAEQITAARPFAMCPVCQTHGKDSQCVWCHGQRWLTAKRYAQFEAAQQEAIKTIQPK